jgi:hypothetical protein
LHDPEVVVGLALSAGALLVVLGVLAFLLRNRR